MRAVFVLPLLLTTACGPGIVYGGGDMSVTLSDPTTGSELSWDFHGVQPEQFNAGVEEITPPLYYQRMGGGLVNYQVGSTLWLAAFARTPSVEQPQPVVFTSTGPIADCLDSFKVMYLDYHVDLNVGTVVRPNTGFMILRLYDEDIERANPNAQQIGGAIFVDAAHPNLEDYASYSNPGGYQPAPTAAVKLRRDGLTAGSIDATGAPWKWEDTACAAGWAPDIHIEWAMDPSTEYAY